ncbi:MAG TPA: hypothetical protein VH063_19780 [Gaiellaceae bacterium]|jgi:hypothetical protein|nr:hypothetical protein [Gaiellaceae bacterium]
MKSSTWSGWIGFTGCLVLVIGVANFIEGLIAVIRGSYYVLTPSQVIVFDVKTWGWIMILWGIIVALAGLALLAGQGWARWFTIFVGFLTFFTQLGFLGAAQYPLWALTILTLTVIMLYGLLVHWNDAETV